jgi:hypothetical protein
VAAPGRTHAHGARGRHDAANTGRCCPSHPRVFARWRAKPRWFGSVQRVNPFWFVGAAAAVWAIFLTFALGLRSEDFPRDDRQQKTVMLISALLVAGAIGTAVYGGIQGLGANHGVRHGPEVAKQK